MTKPLDLEKEQLEWAAAVTVYVDFVHKRTSLHGNAKTGSVPPTLGEGFPILGPRFVPPSHLHLQKRRSQPRIQASTSYLRPLHIIHPFFYPSLAQCPTCGSDNVSWDSWTRNGPREVHGMHRDETALGVQLRCKSCKKQLMEKAGSEDSDGHSCVATTSYLFWRTTEFWKLPRE